MTICYTFAYILKPLPIGVSTPLHLNVILPYLCNRYLYSAYRCIKVCSCYSCISTRPCVPANLVVHFILFLFLLKLFAYFKIDIVILRRFHNT